MDPIAISRSALDVEWQRLQVIAQNLANENSSAAPGAAAYRPVRLISGEQTFGDNLSKVASTEPRGVRVVGLAPMAGGVRRVHEPGHPHADSSGFVRYPDLDRAAEMTLLIRTSRSYEANLTIMTIAQQMYMRALEVGRR